MFTCLKRAQYGMNLRCSIYFKSNPHWRQNSRVLLYRNFTESSIKNEENESIQHELPDPHVLIQDPNDPNDKPKYNIDNDTEEINISDGMFVDGCIAAMSDFCPEVMGITDEDKENMVEYAQKIKGQRFRTEDL